MSDELRERVAMVNCAGDQWDKPCKVPCVDCLREADAAIALVRAEQADRIAQLEREQRLIVEERDRTFAVMLDRAEKAEADNERLRSLLEVDPTHPYDGIYCRDETIRGLELQTDQQRADNERLRAALREIDSISVHSGGDIHGIHPSHWEAAFTQAQDAARAALTGGENE